MKPKFVKYKLVIVLVIAFSIMMGAIVVARNCQNVESNPLVEMNRQFVLSSPDFYLTVESDYGTPGGEGWYADFSTAYASLDTNIVSGGPGVQYVFVSWSGDATGTNYAQSDPITMDANKTATAVWKTQYYLTVESNHGTPSGGGWKDAGITANAHLDSGTASGGTGVQYVFTNWSDDSTGTDYAASDDIIMDGPKTATAVWKTQYLLDVQSDHGTPSGIGWKDAGTSASAGLDTGTVSGGTGIQYVFTHWGGDATGTSYVSSNSILMDGPKTAVANWKTQYYLTIESDHGTTSGEGWKDAGSSVFAALDTNIVAGDTGTQHVFTNWAGDATGTDYAASDSILMNGPKTATAVWQTQYYLTVASDHGTPSGEGWKVSGVNVNAALDTDVVSGGSGVQYVFTNWGDDATGTNYAASDSITMDGPKTATAVWKTQYYLTVESNHGTPSGDGWKDAGITASAHLDSGTASGGTGVQYVFTNWSDDSTGTDYAASDDILMNGPKTATAVWKTQYLLDVQSDHGTPSGIGWKDAGSSVYAGLDTGTISGGTGIQYVFTHWGGDATGTSYVASDSILMDGPKTAVANWKTQYYLTVESAHGTASGDGWKDQGSSAMASLDTGIVAGAPGTQYVFATWSGDATGSDYSSSDSILMDSPKTATAVWTTQYLFTITSAYGTPLGDGWQDAGSTAYAGLDTDIVSGGVGTQHVFTNWGGDATGTDYSQSNSIIMDSPKTAVANWKTQYLLTVISDYGTPSGGGWYDSGLAGYASLDTDLVSGGAGTQYVFTGWGGDATGTDYAASDNILMDAPKTATANWKTQYLLDVQSDHGTPSGGGWYDSGLIAFAGLDADLVAGGTGTQYVFTGWGGDTTGSNYTASDAIIMDGPKTATANWQNQYMLNVTSEYGTPFGEGWHNASSSVNVGLDTGLIAGTPGIQYVFTNWGGDASGTNYTLSDDIVMDSPKTAVANWMTQYYLNCTTDPPDLIPSPIKTPSGDWFNEDTNVTLEAQDVDGYIFQHWTIDNLEEAIISMSFNITMGAPHSVVAHYHEVETPTTTGTDTTNTGTPTSPPPNNNIVILAVVGGVGIAAIVVVLVLMKKKTTSK